MRETNHLRKRAKESMTAKGTNPRHHPTTTFASWCYAKDKAGWEHGAFISGKCPKCEREEEES